MADSDHDRGRRRRHRGRRRFEDRFGEREIDEGPVASVTTPSKPPTILSKPPSEKTVEDSLSPNVSGSVVSQPALTANTPRVSSDKPVVMLRSRDEGRGTPSASLPSIPSALMSGEISQSYQVHQRSGMPGYRVMRDGSASRQPGQGEKLHSIKLVDDNWHWCEGGMEMLLDQTDYLVVGVLGLQGVGKSTLLSLLLGNSTKDPSRSFVFPQQSKEAIDVGGHLTNGIDMYVTGERIIYLDTQPVLSASVMDHLIHYDKKYPTEFTSVENCVHMQSLQLAAFMLTVCNVVLVVQDCFADLTFLRFLSTAEMLKPASPSTTASDTGSSPDDQHDHQPHIVFIQNRAGRDDYSVDTFREYQQTLAQVFRDSKLRLTGSVSLANGSVIPGLNKTTIQSDVNLFLLPTYDPPTPKKEEALSEYRGYPSFASLLKCLKSQLYSVPRYLLTHTTLTEKNWFHYAARTWDQVRKSQMMSEYNRILP